MLCDNLFNTVTKYISLGSKIIFLKYFWQVCSKYYYKYLRNDFCLIKLLIKIHYDFKKCKTWYSEQVGNQIMAWCNSALKEDYNVYLILWKCKCKKNALLHFSKACVCWDHRKKKCQVKSLKYNPKSKLNMLFDVNQWLLMMSTMRKVRFGLFLRFAFPSLVALRAVCVSECGTQL